MSIYHKLRWCLVLGFFALSVASARAEGFETLELFKQPSRYFCLDDDYRYFEMNAETDANVGWFAAWDHLRWSITNPTTREIGLPGATRVAFYGPHPYDLEAPDTDPLSDEVVQRNTLDTSGLTAGFTYGDRLELGHMANEHAGWAVSGYGLKNQTGRVVSSGVSMVFEDPLFGDTGNRYLEGIVGYQPELDAEGNQIPIVRNLPVTFADVEVVNRVEHWSVELSYIHRTHKLHHGGYLEWYFGARYFEFNENFNVDARGDRSNGSNLEPFGTILADSIWETTADNHVVGPQIGVKWFRRNRRWTVSTEGRFCAGLNAQNLHQRGTLGSETIPPGGEGESLLFGPTSFTHAAHIVEFTPMVEFRAQAIYRLTQAIDVRVGWTGIFMDGIARPSSLIDYRMPDMGLLLSDNRQDVFVQGFSIGLDINR